MSMTLFKKIIGKGVSETIDSIGNAIDKIDNSEVKKELELRYKELLIGLESKLIEASSNNFQIENKGNWLQRSWRPILMFVCILIIFHNYYLATIFNLPKAELDANIWDIIKIGLGIYLPLRSLEKFAPNLKILKKKKK